MIKRRVFLVLLFYLLTDCSAYNRILISEDNGLKTMRLTHSPYAGTVSGKDDLTVHPGPKMNFSYLYEQKGKIRPVITLHLTYGKPVGAFAHSMLMVSLGSENISLISADEQYIIPENLWIPMIHAPSIYYKLNNGNKEIVIKLNDKEREKLIEFFTRAVKHREAIFPAIPEGQKKW